jgi:hypothetical protein
MRKSILLVMVALLALIGVTVYAAPPPGGPQGLARALAAQEAHNPQLLAVPGVVGTAVGLTADGKAAVEIFTEGAGVAGLPNSLDGVPVVVEVTGKLVALKGGPPGTSHNNNPPIVTITSPADGSHFSSGASINFAGTATDKQDGTITDQLVWTDNGDLIPDGNGGDFTATLSDGNHTITASVTDSGGKTGSASVSISVGTATTDRWPRPVPIGISTGNATAQDWATGTIAARVKDASGNVYALSNNHVYALENQAAIGSEVLQPGLYDTNGVNDPDNYLGNLSAFVSLNFSGNPKNPNYVDAAIASTTTNRLGKATPTDLGGYGVPDSTPVTAAVGMAVQKFGRTTQLTKGQITGINATVRVTYDSGTALFKNQIVVGSAIPFIKAGDSGSLLVTDNDACNPVGLLFAGNGSGTTAIANRIDLVLIALGVNIDGK